MKRTFGKILSFALVLAMVLSMVPVVLAATTTGNPQYLALGDTAELTCTGAKYWVSSNPSAVSVTKTATGRATITALSTTSSGWGYGTATISAYEKESDYTSTNYADRHDARMTWSVTVSEWKVTLRLQQRLELWLWLVEHDDDQCRREKDTDGNGHRPAGQSCERPSRVQDCVE